MATSPWNDPRVVLPADGDNVWAKQPFGHPFMCVWDAIPSTFRFTNPQGVDVNIPLWEIWLWRPL